jgi:hypothetical protein
VEGEGERERDVTREWWMEVEGEYESSICHKIARWAYFLKGHPSIGKMEKNAKVCKRGKAHS